MKDIINLFLLFLYSNDSGFSIGLWNNTFRIDGHQAAFSIKNEKRFDIAWNEDSKLIYHSICKSDIDAFWSTSNSSL